MGTRELTKSDARVLDNESWNRLQEVTERFEKDCAEAFPRRLDDYLPSMDDPLRATILDEILRVDLELHFRNGKKIQIEDYLRDFPELSRDKMRLASLVEEEYRVRSRFAGPPAKEEYFHRFPDLQTLLTFQNNRTGQDSKAQIGTTLEPKLDTTANIPFAAAENLKKVRRIGEGGFGEVWEALAPGGVHVAVKRIFATVSPSLIEREKQSLNLICSGKFRHPFLLQVFGWWVQDDRLHIVMELADESLDDRLRAAKANGQGGLSAESLKTVMRDAGDALDFLNHECNVLHRDVKPANMLLMGGRLKLCDFGLARLQPKLELGIGNTPTLGGGTPVCIAPEVVQGYQSIQSDQYSLAASYYLMRTGKPLFRGKASEIKDQQVRAMPQLDKPEFSEGEKRVLSKALAKEPNERFPTSSDFVNALLSSLEWDAPRGRGDVPETLPMPAGPRPGQRARAVGTNSDPGSSMRTQTPDKTPADNWQPVKRSQATRIGSKADGQDADTARASTPLLNRWWVIGLILFAIFGIGMALGSLLLKS